MMSMWLVTTQNAIKIKIKLKLDERKKRIE